MFTGRSLTVFSLVVCTLLSARSVVTAEASCSCGATYGVFVNDSASSDVPQWTEIAPGCALSAKAQSMADSMTSSQPDLVLLLGDSVDRYFVLDVCQAYHGIVEEPG